MSNASNDVNMYLLLFVKGNCPIQCKKLSVALTHINIMQKLDMGGDDDFDMDDTNDEEG